MEARVGPVTRDPGGRWQLSLSRGPVRPISTWKTIIGEELEEEIPTAMVVVITRSM